VKPRRVVSLVPSVTETLIALGAPPVACTRFCEQPSIPSVCGTKDPDVAAIVALAPDVVVMNDEENRREDFEALRGAGLTVEDVSPRSVDAVGEAVRRLAEIVDAAVPPPFDEWRSWTAGARRAPSGRRAVTMVWRRPWMTLGIDTYGASLLEVIGIATDAGGATERYPEVGLDDVIERAPDLVVLPSEPYPFSERHRAELLAAMPGSAVELVDGQDLFWWGARTPDAINRLRAHLTP
jgi:ABC-type hemin transport system substrate-binding protein